MAFKMDEVVYKCTWQAKRVDEGNGERKIH